MYLACFSTGMKELLSMQVLFWPSKTWSMKYPSSRTYEKRVMCKLTFVFIYVNWPLYCRGVISYFALSHKSIINGGNFWWETKQNNNKTATKKQRTVYREENIYLAGRLWVFLHLYVFNYVSLKWPLQWKKTPGFDLIINSKINEYSTQLGVKLS